MNAIRYNLIFYDEDKLSEFILKLTNSKGKNMSQVLWAYIKHDKDVFEATGELKKEHFHLFLEFPSSVKDRDLITLLDIVGVGASAISHQKTDRNFLAYLTHDTINSELKARYNLEDIKTNIDKELLYQWYYEAVSKINKPSRQSVKISEVNDYITRINDIVSNNIDIINNFEFTKFLIENNEQDLLYYYQSKAYFVNNTIKDILEKNKIKKYSKELKHENEKSIDYFIDDEKEIKANEKHNRKRRR